MARFEFRMPDVGEGLADVELVQWLVNVGDKVEEDQPIAEVETAKAIVVMPAPASGKVVELAVKEGDRVDIGSLLLVIETADEAAPIGPVTEESTDKVAKSPVVSDRAQDGARPTTEEASAEPAGPVQASPVARKLARELGVPLDKVTGTGPRGRITADDVQKYADDQKAAPSEVKPTVQVPAPEPTSQVEVERVPLRGLRRRIAEAMTHSARTIPHVCGFHEFDATALVAERKYMQRHAEEAGVRLSFLPFIVKASVEALKQHPYLNSSFDDEAQAILLKKVYNIGIAIATDEGLVVPVIHGVDGMDLFEIARKISDLVGAARERRLTPADMQHGTFTITNVGPAGGWFGTSIIRYPEAAILGVGKIEDRAVVRSGQIVARPILPVSLTFDHRVIDGDEGLAFVRTLRYYLEEDPRSLSG